MNTIKKATIFVFAAFAGFAAANGAADSATRGEGRISDLWRHKQMALFAGIDNALAAHAENAITGNFSAVRKADVQLQTELGGLKSNFGVNVIGAFKESDTDAVGWQARIYAGAEDSKGANAGAFYRRIKDNALYGVNVFADYEDGNYGNFLRYSFGGEVQNTIFAVNANYYIPETEPRRQGDGGDVLAFSRRGFDANVRVNVRRLQFLKVRADYYDFDGKGNTPAEDGFRYGMEVAFPQFENLQVAVLYDSGAGQLGGNLNWIHTFGGVQTRQSGGGGFSPDLFAAVSREYSQRIALVTTRAFAADFGYHSSVFVTGFLGTAGMIAASGGAGGYSYAFANGESNGFTVVASNGQVRFSADIVGAATATIAVRDSNPATPPVSVIVSVSAIAQCGFIAGCPALGHNPNPNLQRPPALSLAIMMANAGADVNSDIRANDSRRIGVIAQYVISRAFGGVDAEYVAMIAFLVGRGADINHQRDDGGAGRHGNTALDEYNTAFVTPVIPIRTGLIDNGARCNRICRIGDTDIAGQTCTQATSNGEDCAP